MYPAAAPSFPSPYGGYYPNPNARAWWVVGGILVGGAVIGGVLYVVAKRQVAAPEPSTTETDLGDPLDQTFDATSGAQGPQPGDRVDRGIRRDRTGPHPWSVVYQGPGTYVAFDHPAGHMGPKYEMGTAATENLAKKIIRDHYNAKLVEIGYPHEQKDDPYQPSFRERGPQSLQAFQTGSTGPGGIQPGAKVDQGVRQDRNGTHAWSVVYEGPGVYAAYHHPQGHTNLGGKNKMGTALTEALAKKIVRDYWNAQLVEIGYPEEQKDDPA